MMRNYRRSRDDLHQEHSGAADRPETRPRMLERALGVPTNMPPAPRAQAWRCRPATARPRAATIM
jgi:hypothetical protein